MTLVPIGGHALLSDRRSAALVTSAGSIDWLCMPRIQGPHAPGGTWCTMRDEGCKRAATNPPGR
ncbi:hypothetical protein BH10ACT10_BH10ACT10_00540 [soil metagenome]